MTSTNPPRSRYDAIIDKAIHEHIIAPSLAARHPLATSDYQNRLMSQRLQLLARKCLCGASQYADGTLPCGH